MNRRPLVAGATLTFALVLGGALPSRAAVIGVTVGTTPSQVLAAPTAAPRHFIEIDNEATGTTAIACAFGGATPALNSAGSYTIPAGQQRVWNGALYRSWDPINCISAAAGTPVTIEYQ
jgi:hypothetical protein